MILVGFYKKCVIVRVLIKDKQTTKQLLLTPLLAVYEKKATINFYWYVFVAG